ncbi:MAG: hypothetical protein HC904_17240 [Blastochloris sp.]|nr:hypothetical protein [Blastochloris sp.]
MDTKVQTFIDQLSARHRVIVLGGLAVIAHGYSRHTQDVDIWLEPMSSVEDWVKRLNEVCSEFPGSSLHGLPNWVSVSGAELQTTVSETGLVRVSGLGCALDIFRRPNQLAETQFDQVIQYASKNRDGTFLPDAIDLIQTKSMTGRDKGLQDILYLESVVRSEYKIRLPQASLEEAESMLGRYSEWQVLEAALKNPLNGLRALARRHLEEFAREGDPFSKAILEGRELP